MALKKSRFGTSLQSALGRVFSVIPLTANQITLLALLFAAAGFYAAYLGLPFHAIILFLFAAAVDAIDGAVARFRKEVSDRGAYIDGITDRLVEFLFILSFFFFLPGEAVVFAGACLILILFFGTCMTSFATAYAEHRHVADSRKIGKQPGILPRAERLIALFVCFILLAYSSLWAYLLLPLIALLCIVTFIQRFLYFSS